MEQREPNSKIARKYVSFMDRRIKSTDAWLECKRNDDNVGKMWRIHDDLYDLSDFVQHHPGGASWLTMTQGTDCTEAFEAHHLNMPKVEQVMRKYHVSKAAEPRNILLTFNDDGFYRTLKRRVVKRLAEIQPQRKEWLSNLMLDCLLLATYLSAIVSTYYPWAIVVTGQLMMWLVIGAHNYLHMRDNFRMYYFNIGFFSFSEWRVSHALSHHLFTNSMVDMEMTFFEPVLNWWPTTAGKGVWNRYGSWLYEWILYTIMFGRDFVLRMVYRLAKFENLLDGPDLVPFTLPLVMFMFGNTSAGFWYIIRIWLVSVCTGSFIFGSTALNGGHHHPEVFHDGDPMRDDFDWGIFQVDTMIDRAGVKNSSRFRSLTQFGDHIMHHLFPTLDHGVLKHLYGPMEETLTEFGVESRAFWWPLLIAGQHQQLARTEPMLECAVEKRTKAVLAARMEANDKLS